MAPGTPKRHRPRFRPFIKWLSWRGLLFDPDYTGKGMAGLLDLAGHGRWGKQDHVVFLYTGGVPALWDYADRLV